MSNPAILTGYLLMIVQMAFWISWFLMPHFAAFFLGGKAQSDSINKRSSTLLYNLFGVSVEYILDCWFGVLSVRCDLSRSQSAQRTQ